MDFQRLSGDIHPKGRRRNRRARSCPARTSSEEAILIVRLSQFCNVLAAESPAGSKSWGVIAPQLMGRSVRRRG